MNTRQIAYEILENTILNEGYTNLSLKNLKLSPQDQSFVTRLVYESLQNYDSLAYQTSGYLTKHVPKKVEIMLVMGACQYFKMDAVQDYAIVNEMVELSKKVAFGYSGLINAVLKKMMNQPFKMKDDGSVLENLAVNTSHPLWMTQLLAAQYGEDVAKEILEINNIEPVMYVRFNPLKTDEKSFVNNYPVQKIDNSYIAQKDFLKTNAISDGYAIIQDKTSQKITTLFDLNGDENILDACSAPGTKTSQLAIRVPKGSVTAIELHQHRGELVENLMERLGIVNVVVKVSDFTQYHADILYDAILCDVPCSGLGVLRRKPDLKYRVQPEDLDNLQKLQKDILDHAAQLLKIDGQLVYSTCTLNRKENEKQINAFLLRHSNFQLIHEETILGVKENSDGFYMARLIKKA